MRNPEIAERLRQAATLLRRHEASPSRVADYRRAADRVAALDAEAATLDADALSPRLGVDRALAEAIVELAQTDRLTLLDRLSGTLAAEARFRTLPGIGPRLAREIHDLLRVDTLEALALAARDGRLAAVPGIGPRRLRALRAALRHEEIGDG